MALALVAYGSSDESDDDSQESEISDKVITIGHNVPVAPSVPHSKDRETTNSNSSRGGDCDDIGSDMGELKKGTLSAGLNGTISDEEESSVGNDLDNEAKSSRLSLLSLPTPKITKLHDIDFDWGQLMKTNNKKSIQPIKISVPSLTDLDPEEDSAPAKKKLKPSTIGSGLFALLPSPKNAFVNPAPRQILKPVQKKPMKPKVFTKPVNSAPLDSKIKSTLTVDYDDSPDEDEGENVSGQKLDFFSLDAPQHVAAVSEDIPNLPIDASVDIDRPLFPVSGTKTERHSGKTTWNVDKKPNPYMAHNLDKTEYDQVSITDSSASSAADSSSYIPFNSEDLQLDQEALQKLCGRRERQKGTAGIQLIDLNGDAMVPDSREWLTKQLTEEQNTAVQSHKKKDGPTTQQRRKHQITYLAFQAKEHELELKNQWANNRMSRKQTQAKYGF